MSSPERARAGGEDVEAAQPSLVSASPAQWSRGRSGAVAAFTGWVVAACGFALATASVHEFRVLWLRYVRHELTWTGREFLWMGPLSYLIVFVPFGVLWGLTAAALRPMRQPALARSLFGGMATFAGLVVVVPGVHPLASLILAMGVAARLVDSRVSPKYGWVPMTARLMAIPALIIGACGGLGQMSREWREGRAVAALPAPRNGAPNVVLIVLDAVRSANLSAYGYAEPTTPVLGRVAREGVLFERAIATAPWTLPSHAGMFTGLNPGELHADWKVPFTRRVPTLAELLRDRGWETGLFAANYWYLTWESGLGRGFTHVDDYKLSLREIARSNIFLQALGGDALINRTSPWMFYAHDRRDAPEMVDRFLGWQRQTGARPFFAFINLLDAHEPYHAPAQLRARFAAPTKTMDVADYDAAIAGMDGQIGRLVDSLRSRGVLDRTLLVVTSDHGQMLGEHGLAWHGNSEYLHVLQVPLIVRFPGKVPAGKRVRGIVSLRDLAPTILDIVSGPAAPMSDRSLARYWRDSLPPDSGAGVAVAQVSWLPSGGEGPVHYGPIDALITDRWHYIEGPRTNRELYDYMVDPFEIHDLGKDPVFSDTLRALSRQLRGIAPTWAPLPR